MPLKHPGPSKSLIEDALQGLRSISFTKQTLEYHHEKGVDAHVQDQRRKRVARVAVVPHEDLEGHHDGRVEQEDAADQEHACHMPSPGRLRLVKNAKQSLKQRQGVSLVTAAHFGGYFDGTALVSQAQTVTEIESH